MSDRRKEKWTVFSSSHDYASKDPQEEETKEIGQSLTSNEANEGTALLNDHRRQQQQNGKQRAIGISGAGLESGNPALPPEVLSTTDSSATCCDVLTDFCLHGFCPPESYYKVQPNAGKKPWMFWHCWHPTANLKQIFVRDRDSNLNCLDGIRYTPTTSKEH